MREWCPSTTGPQLPTMTDSLLAPGQEVLYKRYHTGELVEATILGPSAEGDDFVRLKYTRNGRVIVKTNGRAKKIITTYLHFAIRISVGVDQEGEEAPRGFWILTAICLFGFLKGFQMVGL